jgi:archaellum component FlaC
MTIDERLDRLVDRHEALAQSVELLSIETRELRASITQETENIRELRVAISEDAENIRALARIAEIHERRLTRLEGGEEQH